MLRATQKQSENTTIARTRNAAKESTKQQVMELVYIGRASKVSVENHRPTLMFKVSMRIATSQRMKANDGTHQQRLI